MTQFTSSHFTFNLSSFLFWQSFEVAFSILVAVDGEGTQKLKEIESALDSESVEVREDLDDNSPENDQGDVGFGGLDVSSLTPEEIVKHLTCQVCGKVFSRYNNRMIHEKKYHRNKRNDSSKKTMLKDNSSGKFLCKICSRVFSRIDFLKTHYLRVHTNHRPFFCECGNGFVRKHDMIWHQNTHVKYLKEDDRLEGLSNKAVECSLCDMTFTKMEKLNEHIQLLHIDNKFQCSQCQIKFFTKEELMWHSKHPDKTKMKSNPVETSTAHQFTCNICNHNFSDISFCRSHILRLHSLSASLRDSSCFKQLNEKLSTHVQSDLDMNVQIKEEDEMDSDFHSSCQDATLMKECDNFEECDKISKPKSHSSKKSFLEEHSYVSKNTNLQQQSFFCSCCGKEFNSIRSVNAHEKGHANERLFECKDCGKAFQTKSKYKAHSLIHTDVKPFSCPVCHLNFRTSSNLVAHRKRHSTDPGYVCKTCGKDFLSHSGLSRHEILHTGQKAFSCEECGKSFVTPQECNRHMKYHTGEKPHACKYCDKRFYESGHLTAHIRSHTNEKPYSCLPCSRSFDSSSKLIRHNKTTAHIRRSKGNQSHKEIEKSELDTNSDYDEEPHRGPNVFDDVESGESDNQIEYAHDDGSEFLKEERS